MIKELVKANVVDINKLLLENYHKMNLDETELVVLLLLFNAYQRGKQVLRIKEISSHMSIDQNTASKIIQGLINRGMIEICVDYDKSNKKVENFELDPLCRMLEDFFIESDSLEKMVSMVENELGQNLSSLELEVVMKWDKYPKEEIKEAIFKAKQLGKANIKYIDAILANPVKQGKTEQQANEKAKAMNDFLRGIKR